MDTFRAIMGVTLLVLVSAPSAGAQEILYGAKERWPQCELSTDCNAPLVCRQGYCRRQCNGHRDCEGEETYCVKSSEPDYGVCAPRDVIDASWFPQLRTGMDRWGDDLESFPLARRDPLVCHSECVLTRGCVAWTYAEPGVHGQKLPRCYLKDGPGELRPNRSTTSGEVERTRARRPGRRDSGGVRVRRPGDRDR